MIRLVTIFLTVLELLTCLVPVQAQENFPPPDKPANIRILGSRIQVRYNGRTILEATMDIPASRLEVNQLVNIKGNVVAQALKLTTKDGAAMQLTGTISGSLESFPCAADRSSDGSSRIVRSVIGLSHSLLNRAVYDRTGDWAISVDDNPVVKIIPGDTLSGRILFKINISGSEIILRFRPGFYRYHRGLRYFRPWTYDTWAGSVAGWCSWFAYGQQIDEHKIMQTADVISRTLLPYGLDNLQIDDGYEQDEVGMPGSWLVPNRKFPSGLAFLAGYIHQKGLIPGIWSNMSFSQKDSAWKYRNLFVRNGDGTPASGNWIGYIIDGSNPQTSARIVGPRYGGFRKMGWSYFKVDALRHLRYEGYNSHQQYFERKHKDPVEAYRNVVESVRRETGKDHFLLACWGIRPELVGLVDGCRIGTDGYCWQELAQYNSFNNIIWRNDPDHMELASPDAYRNCLLTSLTGSLYMLTDKPEYYDSGNLEAAIRTLPVISTRPGQLYDVDPSRSDRLAEVNTAMSGSGPRLFDASCNSPYDLFLEEVNKPYENWMLLARAGLSEKNMSFRELGLDPSAKYLVFEFWTKTLLGAFLGSFAFPPMDTGYRSQLFCIRTLQDHPQLVATNRHYSCGALEVKRLGWASNSLSGSSSLTADDSYTLYIHESPGYSFLSLECPGVRVISNAVHGALREIQLKGPGGSLVNWKINYIRM
jgi:hypothetical protein